VNRTPIDPRVGVEKAPRYPELEGLTAAARWRLIAIAKERYGAGRAASRFARFLVIGFIWLLGLGFAAELINAEFHSDGFPVSCVLVPVDLVVTGGLAWATSRWIGRMWVRMNLATLLESRACYRCDYPLPLDRGEEPTCPECGLANDLRERRWWPGHDRTGRSAPTAR